MRIDDWRQADPSVVARWYAFERARWHRHFFWETDDNWRKVEAARQSGRLPGLLAFERERSCGWAFFLHHREALQIGALTAESGDVAGALLEGVLGSPEAHAASSFMTFVPATTPQLGDLLGGAGFDVQVYRYMWRPLSESAADTADRHWSDDDMGEIARLLSRAYPGSDPTRPFAPGGSFDEWVEYVDGLVAGTACGRWLRDCSVRLGSGSGQAVGVALVTKLEARTVHLAQIAVDTTAQGGGIGRALVAEACLRARRAGYERATLLVAGRNQRAVRLYERLGFTDVGAFLCATRSRGACGRQPRVSTSEACSISGATTRR